MSLYITTNYFTPFRFNFNPYYRQDTNSSDQDQNSLLNDRELKIHTAYISHGLTVCGMEREDLKGSDDLMCWHLGNNINIDINHDEHSHTNDPDINSNSHNNNNSNRNSNGNIDRILPSSTTTSSSSRLLDKYIMQEDVCVPYCMSVPSDSHKIHGIAEVCTYVHDDLATAVLSLFDTSASSQSTTSIPLDNTPYS